MVPEITDAECLIVIDALFCLKNRLGNELTQILMDEQKDPGDKTRVEKAVEINRRCKDIAELLTKLGGKE